MNLTTKAPKLMRSQKFLNYYESCNQLLSREKGLSISKLEAFQAYHTGVAIHQIIQYVLKGL